MELYGTVWNCMELYGTVWNCMELYGTVWNCMELYGTVWNCMELYGTVWNCMEHENIMSFTVPWVMGHPMAGDSISSEWTSEIGFYIVKDGGRMFSVL